MPTDAAAIVVGAGVVGLTTAIRLAQAGWAVEVVAERRTPFTTSDVAAAIHFPYLAEPRARIRGWAKASLDQFRVLARDAAAGVQWRNARIVEPTADAWWWELVDDYARQGPVSGGHAYACRVPVVTMPLHMAYLESWATRLGVAFRQARLDSLAQAGRAVVVVNCTGLGARDLVGDRDVVPVRGQVVRVHAPHVSQALLVETDPPTYIIPRPDGVVVGGTAEAGQEGLEPDMATEAAILRRASVHEPTLRAAPVLGRAVGLRPGRPTVRLEREPPGAGGAAVVVHNYGHGGAGVTLSWGCADDVVRLAEPLRRKPL